ncbi:unnamed protein product (mitochondrion) [Plasmodiophora brassicae]|uniref:EF-hand domain-containing protein n=1 Tax=Plasmodiophora brassicae TaxID=37360 RepID=A0A3P3Y1Z7_PLABS|nr:unnamed protein product [Plasmodiophora brassicae]
MNHTLFHNGMLRLWATRHGKTVATVPILGKTRMHYKNLFNLLGKHIGGSANDAPSPDTMRRRLADQDGSGKVDVDEFLESARSCGLEFTRDQVADMISSCDHQDEDTLDFNEFQNLMDRDVGSLSARELSSGTPFAYFMLTWQRRLLMSHMMDSLELSPTDISILKHMRRLAAERRDQEKRAEIDRYWAAQYTKTGAFSRADALSQVNAAEEHRFQRLHERLCGPHASRRFRGHRQLSLLEAHGKVQVSLDIMRHVQDAMRGTDQQGDDDDHHQPK